jgi:hypothetical protein
MPTFSFPPATFVIEGDPELVRETGHRGAGDALDTTVDWADGRISGRELAFRTAGFAVATAFAPG